jgi:hypothetical protein
MRTNQAMLYSMKWCRKFLEVTNACVSIAYLFAKVTSKKYSTVKITGDGRSKRRGKECESFFGAPWRG